VNYLEFTVQAPEIPDDMGRLIRQMMKEHQLLKITVEPVRSERSVQQNRLFSKYVRRMAWQSGLSFEDMKDVVKRHAIDMGYPTERKEDGTILIDRFGPVPLASHKADVKQFALLIESCEDLAYEYGLSLD
jgi:hypothetical protein